MIVSQQLLTVWNRVLLLRSRAEIPWVHGPACVVGVREERARDRCGRVLSRQERAVKLDFCLERLNSVIVLP